MLGRVSLCALLTRFVHLLRAGNKALEKVVAQPGKMMRYYIERAIAIDRDPSCVHPRTPAHDKRMKILLDYLKQQEELYAQAAAAARADASPLIEGEVEARLRDFVMARVVKCPSTTKALGDPAFQEKQKMGTQGVKMHRCFCNAATKPIDACSFTINALKKELAASDKVLYEAGKVRFQSFVQETLGLAVGPILRFGGGLPLTTIFAFRLRTETSRAGSSADVVEDDGDDDDDTGAPCANGKRKRVDADSNSDSD